MSSSKSLQQVLEGIAWSDLAKEVTGDKDVLPALAANCERLALWANVLLKADPDNVANPFLREMQRSSHDTVALISLALYVPAAATMRASCEAAVYYSYFRNHPAELVSLVTQPEFYVRKSDILDFHKEHTPNYRVAAREFGFPTQLNTWYSNVSAVVHGQLPGAWAKRLSLTDTKHDPTILKLAVKSFSEGVSVISNFLLLTVGAEHWARVHHEAKKIFLKGMPAARRNLLQLDGK